MTEVAEVVTEAVADVAEEIAENAEVVAEVSRRLAPRDVSLVTTGVVVGLGLGAVAGYFWTKRRIERKAFEEASQRAETEIREMNDHFNAKITAMKGAAMKGQETPPPIENLGRELGYAPKSDKMPLGVVPPKIPRPITNIHERVEEASRQEVNVFDNPTPEWDYAVEVKSRTSRDPHIIHKDEFESKERDHEKVTLTYFEGDDVLTGEKDEMIDMDLVDADHLDRFGHGSGDPNVLYVHNPIVEIDYEILRSRGSYSEEVQGMNIGDDLQHSAMMPRRRMSFDDE